VGRNRGAGTPNQGDAKKTPPDSAVKASAGALRSSSGTTKTQKPKQIFDGLQIHWKDGLPKDRAEDSTIESTLITSGLTSKFSAILRLNDGDVEATEEEMERIEEEQANQQMELGEVAAG